MKLTAEQLAAIDDEVSPSMENMMIVWVDPQADMSAVSLPYEPIVEKLVEARRLTDAATRPTRRWSGWARS